MILWYIIEYQIYSHQVEVQVPRFFQITMLVSYSHFKMSEINLPILGFVSNFKQHLLTWNHLLPIIFSTQASSSSAITPRRTAQTHLRFGDSPIGRGKHRHDWILSTKRLNDCSHNFKKPEISLSLMVPKVHKAHRRSLFWYPPFFHKKTLQLETASIFSSFGVSFSQGSRPWTDWTNDQLRCRPRISPKKITYSTTYCN